MNKLIVIIGCLILTLIISLTLTWPKYQDIKVLQVNIKAKEIELQSQEEYFSKIKEVAEQLKEYPDALAKISSASPETPSLPSLFNFLQTIASQTGLLLEQIDLGNVMDSTIQATLKLNGDYSSFKNFLLAFEKSSRIIEVVSVEFETPEDLTKPFIYKIAIKTFYR